MLKKVRLQIMAVVAIVAILSSASVTVGAEAYYTWSKHRPVFRHIPTPYEILGYNVGEDGKLTYWNKIVEYHYAVAQHSDRVKVFQFGWTEMGKPMIISVITSPSNWARMGYYKGILKALGDPRVTLPNVAKALSTKGIPIVWVECNQHSPETGSAEMSMELLYKLASSNEKEVREILDNVIVIINPSINPDGHDMMTEWHYTYAGTEWMWTSPPYTGKYISHDNNRDWFTAAMKENQYNQKAILEWRPQIFLDLHESGPARIFVPPNPDPVNPEISPIIRASWIMTGGYIITQACTKNLPGYVCGVTYDMWYPGYGDTWPSFHHAIGETFETDRGRWARYIEPKDLKPLEKKGVLWNQPMPWTGGWWTLRDNINYQEGAVWSCLELAARFKDKILWSFYQAAYQMVEKGKTEPPYAFIVPPDQKDPGTMAKMLNRLITQGVEVHVAKKAFEAGGAEYPAGTYIIRMDQPYRGYAKTLLEVQYYGKDWPTPYDVTAWTLPYMMGVKTMQIDDPAVLSVPMSLVSKVTPPPGEVIGGNGGSAKYYVFSHDMNNAIIAMNRLLKGGYQLYLAAENFTAGGKEFPAGTIIVPAAPNLNNVIRNIAKDLYLKVYAINNGKLEIDVYKVEKPDVGLFYGYTQTMDEGWTRWLLEQFEFDYTRVDCDWVKSGNLSQFDVILLPRMTESAIVNGPTDYPPEYSGGIGTDGVNNLKAFVEAGGTLVCEDRSSALPINRFGIGVTFANIKGVAAPGSILKIDNINNSHPIGFGYSTKEGAAFWESSYAFNVDTGTVLATYYSQGDPFLSGYLVNGTILSGKAAAAVTSLGEGNVVLFAFRVLNRAQPDNTFQLYFNSIFFSTADLTKLP